MIAQLQALKETRGSFISLLFRLYMLIYAIFVLGPVSSLSSKVLLVYALIVGVCVFLTLYSVSWGVNVSRWVSFATDTLFVGVFFFYYGCFDTYSLTLALLPIIGIICMSNLHFNKFLAISIPLSVYAVLSWHGEVDVKPFIAPFSIVGIIVLFGDLYDKLQDKILTISEIMDSFFVNKENLLKSYKIYNGIIDILNEIPLPIDIEAIYCFFKPDNDSVYLYNASKYVWSYSLESHKDMDASTPSDTEKNKDLHLVVNGQPVNSSKMYTVSLNDGHSYLFVVELGETGPFANLLSRITFDTLFRKLAKLYESERLQNEIASKRMIALSEKANYVNSAVSTLHFMRNKLSPMKTFFSIQADMKAEKDPAKLKKMKAHLDEDVEIMRESYQLMIERANQMLDDSVTPFVYSSTQRFALRDLLSEIRQSWRDYRLDESAITIQLQNDTEAENSYVYYNQEGLGLVLDNWISNICKYSVGKYSLNMVENEQNVILTFANGYDPKKSLGFVRCYSKDNRAEINKNKWHGLSNMKNFLEQMHIQDEMSNDKDNIYFTITFSKTAEHEESVDN